MLLRAELYATSKSTRCSSQLSLRKFSNSLIISSTLLLEISVRPFVSGGCVFEGEILVPRDLNRDFQNLLIKMDSLSKIILSGRP